MLASHPKIRDIEVRTNRSLPLACSLQMRVLFLEIVFLSPNRKETKLTSVQIVTTGIKVSKP